MEFKVGFSLFKPFSENIPNCRKKGVSARNHFSTPSVGLLSSSWISGSILASSQPLPQEAMKWGEVERSEKEKGRGCQEEERGKKRGKGRKG